MMKRAHILIVGLGLVIAGVLGLVLLAVPGMTTITPGGFTRLSGSDASLGARIFLDGIGTDGVLARTAVGPGMMGGGCVTCHGIDGRGGTFRMMMGSFEAPDITYATLTGDHVGSGDHAEDSDWSDQDILRAIEEGAKPDGERLDPFMPRWRLSDEESDALLDYLKELSE